MLSEINASGRPAGTPWWKAPTSAQVPTVYAAIVGVTVVLVGAATVLWRPAENVLPVAAVGVALLVGLGTATLLARRPAFVPWGAIGIFCLSDELRLRLAPEVGIAKDAYVGLMVALVAGSILRRPSMLDRARPVAGPAALIGVLAALYLLDPAGGHGARWFFGARLLWEVLALCGVGLFCSCPEATSRHLVRAVTVFLPLEAVFAWAQQAAGVSTLTYVWQYQLGAQTRTSSDGGLRTSGTFEDPFQLAALAVLGIVLALFVANRRQAAVLLTSAAAALLATDVRTALVQAAVLGVLFTVWKGWRREAVALAAAGAVAGLFALAVTTTVPLPGAPQQPLLFGLNGRSAAWAQSVEDGWSFVVGNGVGERGSGLTRAQQPLISTPPSYSTDQQPHSDYAGESGFLDSSYAQVQSDVGVVGTTALVAGTLLLAVILARRAARYSRRHTWAALAVLLTAMIDWVGRSSLASYTTGFLTMYILGVLIAAGEAAITVDQGMYGSVAQGSPTRPLPARVGHRQRRRTAPQRDFSNKRDQRPRL